MKNTAGSNVLFTKVQQRLLKLLYLHPESNFNTNELIGLTKSGTGAVQRELERLTIAGIIIVKQLGNQKRYQANQNLAYYQELRNIIIKTFGLADILYEQLQKFPDTHLKIAFIYGSFARQTDTVGSDVDLMLIGYNLDYAHIFSVLQETEIMIGRKINPSCYSPEEWAYKNKKNNHFVKQVMEKPKIFLIGTENELKKLRESC